MPCPITVSFSKSFPVHSSLFLSTFIKTKPETLETLVKDGLLTFYKSIGQLSFKAHIKAGLYIRYTLTLKIRTPEHRQTVNKRYSGCCTARAAPLKVIQFLQCRACYMKYYILILIAVCYIFFHSILLGLEQCRTNISLKEGIFFR